MRLEPTPIPGVHVVELEPIADERGAFARTFCWDTFAQAGITFDAVQCNTSLNTKKHTLRGMHYQQAPHGEPKLVRVTQGRVFDVAVDLRPDSPTHRQWFGLELSADNHQSLYIPDGCAHGFITLEDDCEVFYMMGAPYVADAARGVRYDDPAFGIDWPAAPAVIGDRDAHYPDYTP
ncbi:dTDP-4-dehydrorhamnose 3,5-epimerase [Algisphaera agarilytica]|uniref:dTDP-4-dehydrorhamnose 3,5-epimerase n=1 Tax=Algisphaera agarilytica TaxID=1385975 RepID=A0A7X0H649_9BACT|nr:dTDP-4-dehydrorhamnose 3,5-epimerase [Algisphaera agarilytica]MBB6430016.1 dTDP-4-dehydrorhamnose 3,5-epimerase [Algisphaera agarilytica]